MKILFITANRLGDTVLTTGLLAWLTREYPDARFTIACGPHGADLFRAVPRLERLIVMKKQKWKAHWFDFWRQCIGTQWDLIVDLRSGVAARFLRTKKSVTRKGGAMKHRVVEHAAVLGLEPPPAPQIWITPEALREAADLLPSDRPLLALGPLANWPPKQWPVDHFVDLVKALTAPGCALADAGIMVIANVDGREQIAPLLRSIAEDRRIEIIGRDLQTVAACLTRARLYVGNDSGLMHLSAALGVPTLGLFGPGYPQVFGPWGAGCAFVCTPESREDLLSRLHDRPADAPILMAGLSVERVRDAAKALLARTAGATATS